MKRTLTILALAALSAIASASDPVDNIFGNCQYIMMRSASCRVAIDQGSYPAGGRTRVSGIGWVANEAINGLRSTGYTLGPDGKFAMCTAAKAGCLQAWDSETCKYARGQWRQTPPPTA